MRQTLRFKLWVIVAGTVLCLVLLAGHEAEYEAIPSGARQQSPDSRPAPQAKTWPNEFPRPLRLQNPPLTGDDVVDVQVGLRLLGYDPGPVDGVYGPATARAIREFQRDHGLPVTGEVTGQTLQVMAREYEERLPASQPDKPEGDIEIVVDLGELILLVFVDGEVYKTFPICAGAPSTPTPFGRYKVTEIKKWSGGFGSRWIGLNVPWGAFGIHGTDKPWTIGAYKSHGCVRMLNKDIDILAEWVHVGTPVTIVGAPSKRLLFLDDKGADVKMVQERLAEFGYLEEEEIDGFLGPRTRQALIQFQRDHGLRPDGNVGPETYRALGI